MVLVKKLSKYAKYLLFFVLASVVSFLWPSKDGQTGPVVIAPHAHADAPPPAEAEVFTPVDSSETDSGGGDGGGEE